ncbi:MAG: sulfotransferase, partial [Gammaproteobacteria bacterium]
TTLTEQILSSHPDIYGAGELPIIPKIIKNLPSILGGSYPENLNRLTKNILDTLCDDYHYEIEKLDEHATIVVDKSLVNFLYLGLISLMLPEARIIHCVRDPRDTCLSIYFQNFDESHNYATRLENLGHYYREYKRIMQHWKSLLDMPFLEVHYEDMVNNQESMSRKLIDFVGLDWDERVLRFYDSRRSVVTASYDQVRQKIYTKSTRRWKNYEAHIQPLVTALGDAV